MAGAFSFRRWVTSMIVLGTIIAAGLPVARGGVEVGWGGELSGRLWFGDGPRRVATRFTVLVNDPVAEAVEADGVVRTRLAIGVGAGYFEGQPGAVFGDGTALDVDVEANGDARFRASAAVSRVMLRGAEAESGRLGGLWIERTNPWLDADGAWAEEVAVHLPAGAGFSPEADSRHLRNHLIAGVQELGPDLAPRASEIRWTAAGEGAAAWYVQAERLPVRFACSGVTWRVGEGELVFTAVGGGFVREPALERLEWVAAAAGPTLRVHGDRTRVGNDHYLRPITGVGARLVLRGSDSGRTDLDAEVTAGAGDFEPHFPSGIVVPLLGARVLMSGGTIDGAASGAEVDPGRPWSLAYARNCPDGGCGELAGPGVLDLRIVGGPLAIGVDGGLRGDGVIEAGAGSLGWGAVDAVRMAHRAGVFDEGSFLSPGFALAGGVAEAGADQGAAVLLLSGVGRVGDPVRPERPGTEAYAEGQADYAGFNFRVHGDGSHSGASVLAGREAGPYPLGANSKFVVRRAGVSGVLQAASFPATLELYGFEVGFRGYGVAFLDNRIVDSRTAGEVVVRPPAGFRLPFERLRFGCRGEPGDAELPGDVGERSLEYWVTRFRPRSLEFRRPVVAGPCAVPDRGFLVIGAEVPLPNVARPVAGVLAFQGVSGDFATVADGSPVDSRLSLPAKLTVRGPEGESYRLVGPSRAYFNSHRAAGRPESGFVTFYGRLDVPFFEDVRVQAIAVPGAGDAGFFLAGGWEALDGEPSREDRAWLDGGRTPFGSQLFDAANRGFPAEAGLTAEAYRDFAGPRFHPRARKLWLGMADFDFALKWEPLGRRFGSFETPKSPFLAFETAQQLKQLTARGADLRFAADFAGLPRFNAGQLLLEEFERRTGVFGTVSNAIQGQLQDAAAAVKLTRAVDSLDGLVRDRLNALLDEPLRTAFGPVVDAVLAEAERAEREAGGVAADFRARFCGALADDFLQEAMTRFVEGTNDAGGLVRSLDRALAEAGDGVSSLLSLVARRSPGEGQPPVRGVVQELSKRLLREQCEPPELGEAIANSAGVLLDELLAEYVQELEPVYADIENRLREVQAQLNEVRNGLRSGGDTLFGQLDEAAHAAVEVVRLGQRTRSDLCARLSAFAGEPGGLLGNRGEAELRVEIQRVLEEQVYGSFLPRDVGFILRSRFAGARGVFRQALDQVFANLNDQILGAVRELANRGVGAAGGLMPAGDFDRALGALNDSVAAARLHGQARINGDSLDEARLDGHLKLNVPDPAHPFEFDGFVRYQSADAEPPGGGCAGAAPAGPVVTVGATGTASPGISGNRGGGPVRVGMEAWLGLDNTGRPWSLDGRLSFGGDQDLGGFGLRDTQFVLGFGPGRSYLGARANGTYQGIEAELKVFLGRTCSLAPLQAVDADIVRVLALPEVGFADGAGNLLGSPAGFYLSSGGWFPLERLLGLPPTCLLNLRAHAVHGWFGFTRGSFATPESLRFVYGQRELWGVDGRVLCAVGVTGELTLLGAVAASPANPEAAAGVIAGELKVGAKLGICPLCETFEKRYPVTGVAGRGGVNYTVEY